MLRLPNNSYEAMQLINSLANNGDVEGIYYNVREDKARNQVVLDSIRVKLKTRMVVQRGPRVGNNMILSSGRDILKPGGI